MSNDNSILASNLTEAQPNGRELKTIAKGAGISFIGLLSFTALTFIFQLLLARTLGPANVGIVGLALSVITVASILTTLGVHIGTLRFVALYTGQGDDARAAGAIIAGMRLVGTVSLVGAVVLFGLADWLALRVFQMPTLAPVLRVFALGLPFASAMRFFLSVTQGLKRMEYTAVIEQIAVPLLRIGGLITVVYIMGRGVVGLAYAIVIAFIVGAILAAISVWKLYPLRNQPQQPILNTWLLLAFSWPLLLSTVVRRTEREVQTLILGIFLPSAEVGIFYAALKTSIVLSIFLTALGAIFTPIMAELYGSNKVDQLGDLLKVVTKWGLSLTLPIFLLVLIMSEQIMLIFGPEFVAGATVLQILAVSRLVTVAVGPEGWLLTMSGHPRLNLLNSLLTLGLISLLAFLLIPRFGIIGAAVGSALGLSLVNILGLAEVYLILHIHPYNLAYLKPILAGLLAGGIAINLRFLWQDWPVLAQIALTALALGLVYVAALVVMRLDGNDQAVVDIFFRRLKRLLPV
jgi:O-antigen/teichoic acid export membrane protein